MSKRKKIDEIVISNFKFFPELSENNKSIKIGGNHLLLYGENGAGKSSIFWALYTLLECANKTDTTEIQKYFDYTDQNNLLNINASPINPTDKKIPNSYVSLKFKDDANDKYKISYDDLAINGEEEAQTSNYASDFINYRFLYSVFNFRHRSQIDLFDHFLYHVFPYVKFASTEISQWDTNKTQIVRIVKENAIELFTFVIDGPPFKAISGARREYNTRRSNKTFISNRIKRIISELKTLVTHINTRGNEILHNDLNYPNITFLLKLEVEKEFHLTKRKYTPPKLHLWLSIPIYQDKPDKVHRAHSFLNEARLTVISLAMRLAILEKRPDDAEVKILVLDDLMISLDMSNREKILDVIFKKYLSQYQVFILTHDKLFFEYIKMAINQKSSINDWTISELYVGNDDILNKEYPILIDSALNYLTKADRYFQAKDYSTCSLYIRKELEQLIIERLPNEYILTIDGKFKDLSFYWDRCVERYQNLGKGFSEEIKNAFHTTKLVLLNPQAHHVLTHPVYKIELERAFDLIKEFSNNYPIPSSTILLSKGMILQFAHPTQNYTFDFELLTDFSIDGLAGSKSINFPKCKIISWQFNGIDFWCFKTNSTLLAAVITAIQARTDKLDKILDNLKKEASLAITDDLFKENTKLTNGIWTLKEIIDKSSQAIF